MKQKGFTNFAASLDRRLTEMFVKTREEMRTAETKELVLVKKDIVENVYNDKYPDRTDFKQSKVRGSSEAYWSGVEDGKKMNINKWLS